MIKAIKHENKGLKTTELVLSNEKFEVSLSTYGASIYKYHYLKRNGTWVNLLIHPSDYEDFLFNRSYYGKTVGRTSGRLFLPSYEINGKTHKLESHGDPHVKLHGGKEGFSFQNFEVMSVDEELNEVVFYYRSKDMEEGYPGNLDLHVTYRLTAEGLEISYEATSDEDTLCNLTNHAYFNLDLKKDYIYDHQLELNAHEYLELDDQYHYLKTTKSHYTCYDFTKVKQIKDNLNPLIKSNKLGFDTPFMTQQETDYKGRLVSSESKLQLELYTSYPCVVIYTHNYKSNCELEGINTNGIHSSICLEAQFEPAGIHHKNLNSSILEKDKKYQHYIKYLVKE